MKVKVACTILLLLLLSAFTSPLENTEEYNVKAAFIYKFTNYIEWETPVPAGEFTIGVIGSSPIIKSLEQIARTKTVNYKKIVVKHFNEPEEIAGCQILFVSQNTSSPLSSILIAAPQKGTLVISEKPGYCAMGTGINFVVIDNKLKFEANPKAIYSAGLSASSQLLKLAIIVN